MKLPRRPAVFVSIDPGVTTLGVVVWPAQTKAERAYQSLPPRPLDAKAFEFPAGGTLEEAAERATNTLGDMLTPYRVRWAGIEKMEFFGGSARGQTAAGDVINVSLVAGALFGWFHFRGVDVRLVPVREWKGQLSKDQVARRLLQKWGGAELPPGVKSHAIDAAGIGLFCMEWF